MKIVPLIKIHCLSFRPHIHLFILSILVLLGLVTSCHDKTPDDSQSPCNQNPGTCQSVLDAKDFFLFKVGSYWVYEEESSHERDSIYVLDYSNTATSYDFFVHMKSSLTDYEYRYWPSYYSNAAGCNQGGTVTAKCLYVNRSKGKFQDDLGQSHVFYVGYHIGDWHYSGSTSDCPNNKVTIGAILDTYQIPNYTFQNVVRVDQDCEYAEGKQPTKFYYSKNVGIIRKELIDSNQVWNLVDYNVIQ